MSDNRIENVYYNNYKSICNSAHNQYPLCKAECEKRNTNLIQLRDCMLSCYVDQHIRYPVNTCDLEDVVIGNRKWIL